MKKSIVFLAALILYGTAFGQWKAQSGEMYNKTFRMAFISSKSGEETLRLVRNIPAGTKPGAADPYEQIVGQILLKSKLDKEYRVQCLVFSFDDSPTIYIHQPLSFKQGWDPNVMRYIIESDWKMWRTEDRRDKEVKFINVNPDSIPVEKKFSGREIISMLKSKQKVSCQIVLMHDAYQTQKIIATEFVLQNSTKSINYLFQ